MSGIYIHIPFCKQACHYCNFHFSTSLQHKETLINALIKEIELTPNPSPILEGEIIQTIYFGGGTPSILSIDDLQLIFEAIYKKFTIASDAEITVEANPDDINEIKLQQWRRLGFNRLSVGIQSFLQEELTWMNRLHSANDALKSIEKIQDAGFTNFSVDLIYGSPLLSDEDWKKNVNIVIEKNIPHISCYALTVEPKTALEKMISMQKKQNINAENQASQFLLLMNWMEKAGYDHYEISNFSTPGMRSRHNSNYWSGVNYYGFGPSAHSFDGKYRRWNIANNALYIESLQKNIIPFEEEKLTPIQQLNEYIMTSIRTMEGLDMKQVSVKYGKIFAEKLQATSFKYLNNEKMKIEDEKLILTKKGKLFADGIAADLFFE